MTERQNDIFTGASDHQVVDLLQEQVRLFRAWMQPNVIVDVYPRRAVNMLYFRIRNVGHTPAFNIRVTVDPDILLGTDERSSELNIFNQAISVLGPRDEISFFFDSALELFDKPEAVTEFKATTVYHDADGVEYKRQFQLNLNLLKGLAIELPASDKVLDQLERIHREVEKIARYADSLRSKELQKQYREHQKRIKSGSQTER